MHQDEVPTNTTDLNDLAVAVVEQSAIKGGPRLIIKKAPTFAETGARLPDLEPEGDVKGGAGAIVRPLGGGGGFINNHNETIVTDDVEVSAKP